MSQWKCHALSTLIESAQSGFASGEDVEEGILQVRMNNISSDGRFDWRKKRRVPVPKSGRLHEAKIGDVLFNHTNSPELVGKSAFFSGLDEPVTFSNHFICLRPKANALNGSFLSHWLHMQWRQGRFSGLCKQWVNQATVSKNSLLDLTIPLPPLPEQKRIAAILDQADELRRKRQRAIDRLNQLGQAIFYEMFGEGASRDFPTVRLGDLAELINGDRSANYPNSDDLKRAGILFLNTTNLVNGTVNLTKCNFISEDKFASLSRGKLKRNDLIITLRGTLGQVALFDCEHETGFINAQMMIIRTKAAILPIFLMEQLATSAAQSTLQGQNSGSAVPQLTAAQIADFLVVVPPIELQEKFVARIQKIKAQARLQSNSGLKLKDLFATLQHRAFTGTL